MIKNDRIGRSNLRALAVAMALAVLLPACSDDNGTDGNGPQTIDDSRSVPVGAASFITFTPTRNLTAEAEVQWTSSTNDVDVYATSGNCASLDALIALNCNVVAFSESATAKPERITFAGNNATQYKVWALNLGPNTETVIIRVTLR